MFGRNLTERMVLTTLSVLLVSRKSSAFYNFSVLAWVSLFSARVHIYIFCKLYTPGFWFLWCCWNFFRFRIPGCPVHCCWCCCSPSGLRSQTRRRRPIPPTVEICVSLLWRLTVWVGAPAWQGEGSLSVADFSLCFTRRRGAGVCLLHKGTGPTHDLSSAEGGPAHCP